MNDNQLKKPSLGTFTLTLISVSAIISLRNFPLMAPYGYSAIFFYFFAAILFFIPTALVTAELASTWPQGGGVYHWVRQAFGRPAGGLAIWLEWIEGVVWLPTALSFIAATFAYLIQPIPNEVAGPLSENRAYLVTVMLVVLWGVTFINYLGIKTSGWLSSLGVLFGSILPGLLIIGLGLAWIIGGHPVQIQFSWETLVPDLSLGNIVFFAGVLLSFAGIEIAAYYIPDTKNPTRTFPKATFISAGLILLLSALGSLAIAFVIPASELNLFAGVMQAFSHFLGAFGMPQAVPVLAFVLLIGALALLNTWIIGPSKGLIVSAEEGNLPKTFTRRNKSGSPTAILFAQATLGSLLTSVFLYMPTVNSSYWILIVLTAQLILLMYLMIFISALWLRFKAPEVHRPYRTPALPLVATIGALTCLGTFLLGFVPPDNLEVGGATRYISFLVGGVVVLSLPPFLWLGYEKIRKRA